MYEKSNIYVSIHIRGRHSRDRMVVGLNFEEYIKFSLFSLIYTISLIQLNLGQVLFGTKNKDGFFSYLTDFSYFHLKQKI